MDAIGLGRVIRALRIRERLRHVDLERLARVPRRAIADAESGKIHRLTLAQLEAIVGALGARLDYKVSWHGPDLYRLLDAAHAALQAAVKEQLERWGWLVRVEVSYSRYGERGRIDLLAFHPATGILLVIEIKTELVDVQALLGVLDAKVRLAPELVRRFGWTPSVVLPAIVFAEDKTTRRRIAALDTLFDRYSLRGRACLSWLRRPAGVAPPGLLWFTARSNSRVERISGQRAPKKRVRRPGASVEPRREAGRMARSAG